MTCLVMTMDEMLKLALGTTTPDHVNIAVLHSFLSIIIKKLKMNTDFVEITGPEAKELRQMLQCARKPTIVFESCPDEDAKKCSENEKFNCMQAEVQRLTNIVEKMEGDMKAHLDAVEKCRQEPAAGPIKLKNPRKTNASEDDSYSSECDDTCTPCDEKNLIACDLLQNTTFLKKLMRRVTSPVISRTFHFEKMIGMLNEKFQNFLNIAEDEFKKIPLVEDCFRQLDEVRQQIKSFHDEFIDTMEEIQDMLDNKLDKVHVPALKKYITDRLDEIDAKLQALIKKEECPKAAGVIMNNTQCLCCATRVCQKDRIYPVPLLANVVQGGPQKSPSSSKPVLCIPRDRERACGGNHTIIRKAEKSLQKSNLIDEFGDKMHLRIGTENVEYFKGLDGGMYRLAPDTSKP